MEAYTFDHLRARERSKDDRDLSLGAASAPAAISVSYLPDNSWLVRNFQGQTAFCGEHAGSHLKAILDHAASNYDGRSLRKTPRYGAIKIKDHHSPIYDGFAPDAGTDMRSIFKWLQKFGAADFEPLENNVLLSPTDYCTPAVITPAMDGNAARSTISKYAFGDTDFASICQAIYQYKAVLMLIKCDDGFWGTTTPTFTIPKYGHFVVADGYDANHIRVIDSADPDEAFSRKMIAKQYITPKFILESGTAVDAVLTQVVQQVVTQASSIVTEINNAPDMSHAQKLSLLQELSAGLQAIEGFFQRSQ